MLCQVCAYDWTLRRLGLQVLNASGLNVVSCHRRLGSWQGPALLDPSIVQTRHLPVPPESMHSLEAIATTRRLPPCAHLGMPHEPFASRCLSLLLLPDVLHSRKTPSKAPPLPQATVQPWPQPRLTTSSPTVRPSWPCAPATTPSTTPSPTVPPSCPPSPLALGKLTLMRGSAWVLLGWNPWAN